MDSPSTGASSKWARETNARSCCSAPSSPSKSPGWFCLPTVTVLPSILNFTAFLSRARASTSQPREYVHSSAKWAGCAASASGLGSLWRPKIVGGVWCCCCCCCGRPPREIERRTVAPAEPPEMGQRLQPQPAGPDLRHARLLLLVRRAALHGRRAGRCVSRERSAGKSPDLRCRGDRLGKLWAGTVRGLPVHSRRHVHRECDRQRHCGNQRHEWHKRVGCKLQKVAAPAHRHLVAGQRGDELELQGCREWPRADRLRGPEVRGGGRPPFLLPQPPEQRVGVLGPAARSRRRAGHSHLAHHADSQRHGEHARDGPHPPVLRG
mmetsp:Transcript_27889/g.73748  ORF Transcript_27889/g.73748 Transcript_27889/m.73748 type:complete len:322 (+) Transcript_27889:314-1279(+)